MDQGASDHLGRPVNNLRADTLPARSGEVLPSSSPLARLPPTRRTGRGGLSGSVFLIGGGSRVPHGTGKSQKKKSEETSVQDVFCRIFVNVTWNTAHPI